MKFYATVVTNEGDKIPLIVRGKNKDIALRKLESHDYKQILTISEKKPKQHLLPSTSGVSSILSFLSSNSSSRRFNYGD